MKLRHGNISHVNDVEESIHNRAFITNIDADAVWQRRKRFWVNVSAEIPEYFHTDTETSFSPE